jgi:hypothetical protein
LFYTKLILNQLLSRLNILNRDRSNAPISKLCHVGALLLKDQLHFGLTGQDDHKQNRPKDHVNDSKHKAGVRLTLAFEFMRLVVDLISCDTSKDNCDDSKDNAKDENANDTANHRSYSHTRVLCSGGGVVDSCCGI